MEINLVTSNKNKVEEFKKYLEPEIKVNHAQVEIQEIRADANEVVAKQAAKDAANLLKKPVIVEDSGFFIEAYDGFPGVYTKTIFKKIGLRGFLKLMQGMENRNIKYVSVVAYCEPDQIPHIFLGEEDGIMADEEKGTLGWGQDPIFIPKENNPQQKTYGEIRERGINLFRSRAVLRLKEYLLGQQL